MIPSEPPGAAVVPCVPLQQVTDEELSSHLVISVAKEIAPHHQYFICLLQGHVLCKPAVKVNTVQRWGFYTKVRRRWIRLLCSCFNAVPARCSVQREDASHHNLEQAKYRPGNVTEMTRGMLFSCSHSCTPHPQHRSQCLQEAQ